MDGPRPETSLLLYPCVLDSQGATNPGRVLWATLPCHPAAPLFRRSTNIDGCAFRRSLASALPGLRLFVSSRFRGEIQHGSRHAPDVYAWDAVNFVCRRSGQNLRPGMLSNSANRGATFEDLRPDGFRVTVSIGSGQTEAWNGPAAKSMTSLGPFGFLVCLSDRPLVRDPVGLQISTEPRSTRGRPALTP
jgi:hypothetical protein